MKKMGQESSCEARSVFPCMSCIKKICRILCIQVSGLGESLFLGMLASQ